MNSIRLSRINKIRYNSYSAYSECVTLGLKTSIPPCGYLYSLWNIKYYYFMAHEDSKFYKYVNIYNPFWKTSNQTLLNLTEGDYILVSKVALTKENIWNILSTTDNKYIIKILSYHV